MSLKFVKGLRSSNFVYLNSLASARFNLKLLYEFWGFCVNGTTSLTVPGGFAVSGTNFPSGFTTGSNVTLASGSDGATTFGTDRFVSQGADFETLNSTTMSSGDALVGKFLVTWVPNSDSTDDSVYRISGVEDSTTLRVEVATGGTARLGSKGWFRDRSNVNWRIVDMKAAATLAGWSDNMGMVLQFDGAADVNAGQRSPQAHIALVRNGSQTHAMKLVVSPSGTWNGTNFTDLTSSLASTCATDAAGDGNYLSYLIGDRSSLIFQTKALDNGLIATSVGFHVEVPKRLLDATKDPNPVASLMWHSGSSATQQEAYSAFNMIGPTTASSGLWDVMARAPFGDITHTTITPNSGGIWHSLSTVSRFNNYNSYHEKYLTSDAVLHRPTSGSFCFARARLRRVRYTSNNIPVGLRLGSGWVHVGNGIVWPWDSTQQPHGLLWEGGP